MTNGGVGTTIASSDEVQSTPASTEQSVDSQPNTIQPNESPEITLDRTRRLLAQSRRTLDDAERRLGSHEDEEQPAPRKSHEN